MSDVITKLAQQVANNLIAGGVSLSFKEKSLLAPLAGEVVIAATPVQVESVESLSHKVNSTFGETDPNPFTRGFEDQDVLGNTFTAGVEGLYNDILPIAQGILSTIKDRVIPATNEIFKTAYDEATGRVEDGGIGVDIITDGLDCPIFTSPAVAALLENYASQGSLEDYRLSGISFPELPVETLISNISAVNSSIATELGDLIAAHPTALESTYRDVFNVGGASLETADQTSVDLLVSRLFGLLLAVYYSENIPDGVKSENDNPAIYRSKILSVITGNAKHLFNHVESGHKQAQAGRVVRYYPFVGDIGSAGVKIVVNGFAYKTFLEEGGSVDSILGSYVTDQVHYVNQLNEKREQYEKAWFRFVATKQSVLKDDFSRIFAGALRQAIYNYGNANQFQINEKGIDKMYTGSLTIDEDSAYGFARDVVLDTLFPTGDYRKVLVAVDSIAANNPGIDLAAAVEIATIEWLVDWAIDQMSITQG